MIVPTFFIQSKDWLFVQNFQWIFLHSDQPGTNSLGNTWSDWESLNANTFLQLQVTFHSEQHENLPDLTLFFLHNSSIWALKESSEAIINPRYLCCLTICVFPPLTCMSGSGDTLFILVNYVPTVLEMFSCRQHSCNQVVTEDTVLMSLAATASLEQTWKKKSVSSADIKHSASGQWTNHYIETK